MLPFHKMSKFKLDHLLVINYMKEKQIINDPRYVMIRRTHLPGGHNAIVSSPSFKECMNVYRGFQYILP
jgi:hypothetical protein